MTIFNLLNDVIPCEMFLINHWAMTVSKQEEKLITWEKCVKYLNVLVEVMIICSYNEVWFSGRLFK